MQAKIFTKKNFYTSCMDVDSILKHILFLHFDFQDFPIDMFLKRNMHLIKKSVHMLQIGNNNITLEHYPQYLCLFKFIELIFGCNLVLQMK